MDVGYLIWQAGISIGVYVTIQLNGRGFVHGWLLGALIQAAQLGYGLTTRQYGFLLAALPGLAFLQVWVSKLKERKRGCSDYPDYQPQKSRLFAQDRRSRRRSRHAASRKALK